MFSCDCLGGGDPAWPWFARVYQHVRVTWDANAMLNLQIPMTQAGMRECHARIWCASREPSVTRRSRVPTRTVGKRRRSTSSATPAARRLWMPHRDLNGPCKIEDGAAFVFGQWLEHAFGPAGPWSRDRSWRRTEPTSASTKNGGVASGAPGRGVLGPVDDACAAIAPPLGRRGVAFAAATTTTRPPAQQRRGASCASCFGTERPRRLRLAHTVGAEPWRRFII